MTGNRADDNANYGIRVEHGPPITSTTISPVPAPQHGPGKKHLRKIELKGWQADIVERMSDRFVRGCLDSDGCRHRRIVNGKNYPAYSFKNSSTDILALFCAAQHGGGKRERWLPRHAVRMRLETTGHCDQ